jgi:triosephosphate isomerase (TIM)
VNHQTARKPVIGGNWKMNTTLQEAVDLAVALKLRLTDIQDVEVIVCPPFTNLHAVDQTLAGSDLELGAQDVFWEKKGAYTGEISADMLRSVGVKTVIVGHSERRHILGESSEAVNKKGRAALDGGLRIILAVGETGDERATGMTETVLDQQLRESLNGFTEEDFASVIVAYEPVWAIGTGLTATPDQAQVAHEFIRNWLGSEFALEVAASTVIQYGGSVTSANAVELLGQPDVDGALVGGASLKPDEFAGIVQAQQLVLGGPARAL